MVKIYLLVALLVSIGTAQAITPDELRALSADKNQEDAEGYCPKSLGQIRVF